MQDIKNSLLHMFGKLVEELLQKVQSLWRVLLWKGNYAKYR